MARSSNVYARVDPDVKSQAEFVLEQVGVSPSNMINMLYKQIIFHRGIPFDVRIPWPHPVSIEGMTKEEVDAEFEKARQSVLAGKGTPAEEVNARLRQEFHL